MKRVNRALVSMTVISAVFAAASGPAAGAAVAARSASRADHKARPAFDVKLYESYVRAHHHHLIPYRDGSGKITAFAWAWMKHRSMCGGAITATTLNPRTLSTLQEWQGCTAIRRIGERAIRFHADPWIR